MRPAPLQINYTYSFDGRVAIEPKTGAEVFVKATESLAAKPDIAPLAGLQTLFTKYQSAPPVVHLAS